MEYQLRPYCAVPGTSDHQTALAVRLINNGYWGVSSEKYAETDACQWLMGVLRRMVPRGES